MTKTELRSRLAAGATMDGLFHYIGGQGCLIFKADEFSAGDEIIYIPDIDLNEIVMDRAPQNSEEINEIISDCYSGDDFLNECNGNRIMAERLFWYCDWQHPSSAVDEIDDEDEEPIV